MFLLGEVQFADVDCGSGLDCFCVSATGEGVDALQSGVDQSLSSEKNHMCFLKWKK